MKLKSLFTLGLFALFGVSFSSASGLPTYYDLQYNLCNYSNGTTLNQIINQDINTIQGMAGSNPTCYHVKYYDSANIYSFRSNGNSYLEYRPNNSIYDYGNCAGSFNDLMSWYDLVIAQGDSNMCNQIYNGSLPMYISFYFPYNSQDCSSIQSDYDSCKSSLNTLSGNLASCNSSLSSCESDLLTCQGSSCDIMSSSECQLEYNLIPISSVDSSYCLTNNLCPLISTGDNSNWSALYINNIQHNSAPLINITIPEEFNWDYTGNDEYFDLSISGYNVDSDYIAGIIENQTTSPNNVDFNNLVSGILPLFVPGLVIILFLYFVFRFVKKIF